MVFETAEDRLLVHAAENLQRADLTPLEEARLIRRLMEAGNLTAQAFRRDRAKPERDFPTARHARSAGRHSAERRG